MPGALAQRYLSAGATDVRLVGKPHAEIYAACFAALAEGGEARGGEGAPPRVLAVGDSLHHDVLGASRAGIDSLLVCSGVHAAELGVTQASDEVPSAERLEALLERFAEENDGLAPTHCVAAFRV
tara:strand:- start:109 stop:483 length:375 start_codon:yes stop_codon:yes gene_type:complete